MPEDKDYLLEELLADESFINFLLHRDEANVSAWKSWIAAYPYRMSSVEEAIKLYFVIAEKDAAHNVSSNSQFDAFRELLQEQKAPVKRIFNWKRMAAAAVITAASLFMWNYFSSAGNQPSAVFAKSSGDVSNIMLPDGTLAILNKNASVSIGTEYNENNRKVTLKGSAFFKVKKDAGKPFVVIAGDEHITALGTEFYVYQSESTSSVKVSLLEGRVGVKSKYNYRELNPGEKAICAAGSNVKTSFSITTLNGWINNKISFKDASLEEIVQSMEEYFNLKINVMGNPGKISFTGDFESSAPLTMLQALKFTYEMNYSQRGKEIFIDFR